VSCGLNYLPVLAGECIRIPPIAKHELILHCSSVFPLFFFLLLSYAGNSIVHNLGPVFRTFVPMILYFAIMWTSAFGLTYWLSRYKSSHFGYEMAVVQSFTAGACLSRPFLPFHPSYHTAAILPMLFVLTLVVFSPSSSYYRIKQLRTRHCGCYCHLWGEQQTSSSGYNRTVRFPLFPLLSVTPNVFINI
jgi:hypothetical protein